MNAAPDTGTDVNPTLTPEPAGQANRSSRRASSQRRRSGTVENTDYAAFATRVIRVHARRIATGDVDALADLLDLAHELDTATQTAVDGLRTFGYSWADIAGRLGTTRQAAQQRWGAARSGEAGS